MLNLLSSQRFRHQDLASFKKGPKSTAEFSPVLWFEKSSLPACSSSFPTATIARNKRDTPSFQIPPSNCSCLNAFKKAFIAQGSQPQKKLPKHGRTWFGEASGNWGLVIQPRTLSLQNPPPSRPDVTQGQETRTSMCQLGFSNLPAGSLLISLQCH